MLENLRGLATPRAVQVFLLGGVLAAAIIGGFSLLSSNREPASQVSGVAGASSTPRVTTTVAAVRTPVSAQPTAAGASAQATAVPATYTVKAGDSASLIAKNLGVRDQDLAAWLRDLGTLNNLNPDRLEVGQVLRLPAGGGASNASAASGTAQPGTSGGSSSASGAPGSTVTSGGSSGSSGTISAAGATATSQPGNSSTAAANATSQSAAPTSTPGAPGGQPAPTSTAAPAASTATPGPAPSIAVSPTRVTEGTVMTMTLRNFPPSSAVTVCFVVPDAGFQDCGSVDVDGNGYFSEPGSPLPADIKEFPGIYRMDASGANGTSASASFEVF